MKEHSPRFLALVQEAKSRIRETSLQEVKERLDRKDKSFHLVDVREESEWAASHLPEAIHLSKGIIERDVEQAFPDLHQEIIVYCGGGFRSALVADNLQKMGYTHIISMNGGFRGWTEAGYPVVKDKTQHS